MDFILYIIIASGFKITNAELSKNGPCNSTKMLKEASKFRPVALDISTKTCYLAFDAGPCENGQWFALREDKESGMLTREGYCTNRTCPEQTDEQETDKYKPFSLMVDGRCLIAGRNNSDYCKDENKVVYFNHYITRPVCVRDVPEIRVGQVDQENPTGRGLAHWFYDFTAPFRGDRSPMA